MSGLATLTVTRWEGYLPLPGHYVQAERGRTAFLIVEVVLPRRPCRHFARFRCERASPASLPADAIVHTWVWAKR